MADGRKEKVVRPIEDRIKEAERKVSKLKRQEQLRALKGSPEGKEVQALQRAANVLRKRAENGGDDDQGTCAQIADDLDFVINRTVEDAIAE